MSWARNHQPLTVDTDAEGAVKVGTLQRSSAQSTGCNPRPITFDISYGATGTEALAPSGHVPSRAYARSLTRSSCRSYGGHTFPYHCPEVYFARPGLPKRWLHVYYALSELIYSAQFLGRVLRLPLSRGMVASMPFIFRFLVTFAERQHLFTEDWAGGFKRRNGGSCRCKALALWMVIYFINHLLIHPEYSEERVTQRLNFILNFKAFANISRCFTHLQNKIQHKIKNT